MSLCENIVIRLTYTSSLALEQERVEGKSINEMKFPPFVWTTKVNSRANCSQFFSWFFRYSRAQLKFKLVKLENQLTIVCFEGKKRWIDFRPVISRRPVSSSAKLVDETLYKIHRDIQALFRRFFRQKSILSPSLSWDPWRTPLFTARKLKKDWRKCSGKFLYYSKFSAFYSHTSKRSKVNSSTTSSWNVCTARYSWFRFQRWWDLLWGCKIWKTHWSRS